MVSRRTVTVNLPDGLHLRPLTRIAQTASRFQSQITISNGKHTADAKSALALMQLGAGAGTELVVEADGDDAEAAAGQIVELFERGFELDESAAC